MVMRQSIRQAVSCQQAQLAQAATASWPAVLQIRLILAPYHQSAIPALNNSKSINSSSSINISSSCSNQHCHHLKVLHQLMSVIIAILASSSWLFSNQLQQQQVKQATSKVIKPTFMFPYKNLCKSEKDKLIILMQYI